MKKITSITAKVVSLRIFLAIFIARLVASISETKFPGITTATPVLAEGNTAPDGTLMIDDTNPKSPLAGMNENNADSEMIKTLGLDNFTPLQLVKKSSDESNQNQYSLNKAYENLARKYKGFVALFIPVLAMITQYFNAAVTFLTNVVATFIEKGWNVVALVLPVNVNLELIWDAAQNNGHNLMIAKITSDDEVIIQCDAQRFELAKTGLYEALKNIGKVHLDEKNFSFTLETQQSIEEVTACVKQYVTESASVTA
ncbi:MAG: hypothetical protein WC795_01310 [Candidatus Paceibacterota bacterium]|jgi:hypothetical protein